MPQRRGFTRSARPRRPMDWGAYAFHGTLDNPGGTVETSTCGWIISPDEIQKRFTDPTVMGLRVNCSMIVSATSVTRATGTAGTSAFNPSGVGFGVIDWTGVPFLEVINTTDTNAAPPNPCPHIFSNGNLDWMLRNPFNVVPGQPSGTQYGVFCDTFVISKARRRMGNTKGLLWVISNAASASGTATLNYSFDVRYLLKE